MMCQVEIDVSAERNSKRTLAKLLIGVMLVAGVTLSAAGVHQQKLKKAKSGVAWHNVSDTLHQVERAKADLFATLRDKSP